MPDYEFGNARLRVMKSRLLSRQELEILSETGSVRGLIAALTKTIYQRTVESALTRATGMQCVDDALRNDLVNTVGKIASFYKESAGKLVVIILRSYDIHNIKVILRGLSKNVPAGDMLTALLPVGMLSFSTLRELAQLNSPRDAIDLLASMGFPVAVPLLSARAEAPGVETFGMELSLDKWHYQEARQTLRSEIGAADSLSYALALDADLTNILTALRFALAPHEREHLRDHLGTDEVSQLFLGPGHIPYELLATACRQDTVASAIEALSRISLAPVLQSGLEAYSHSNRLSDIEKRLRHYRLQWMTGQIIKDPLGIGVVLGYVALKVNEINNLRWIAHGLNLGLKADVIRADLEMVT